MTESHADLERAVLGAALLDPGAAATVVTSLEPGWLSVSGKRILKAIGSLLKEGAPVDLVSVVDALRVADDLDAVGGATEVASLVDAAPDTANVGWYCERLRQEYRRRTVHAALNKAALMVQSGESPDDAVAMVIKASAEGAGGRLVRSGGDLAETVIADVAEEGETRRDVVPFQILSPPLLPLHTGGAMVLAGATGTGKSALADQMALNAARKGWPALILGLEMTPWERTARLLSHISGVSVSAVLCREVDKRTLGRLMSAQSGLETLPVYVSDCAGMPLGRLVALIQQEHIQHGIKLVVIDYLQLVHNLQRGRSREQEVAEVSRTLSQIATKLDLCMVMVAQLSRAHLKEKRPPDLHDLRDSGQIEQDAHTVIMLAPVPGEKGNSNQRIAYIRKQRFGQTGRVGLFFEGRTLTFRRPEPVGE